MYVLSYVLFAFDALYLHFIRQARLYSALAVLVFVVLPLYALFIPTGDFPRGALVTVEEDTSFSETSKMLEEKHIISSEILFKALARVSGSDRGLQAGRYVFSEPVGIATVLYRLANGISGIEAVRVTFPEGITVREMGDILAKRIPGFNGAAFTAEAKPYEGYLFPDTYDIYVDTAPEEIIARMRARHDAVWESVIGGPEFEGNPRLLIVMASILEKETKPGEDRRIVAGILTQRLALEMPLQVDAVFGYIKGIDTYHPSGADLDIDSPYNTYKNRGLPPGPIGNPGEDAIRAAIMPTMTKYLYYLSGSDGAMHYAMTFEEHKKNKELYLR